MLWQNQLKVVPCSWQATIQTCQGQPPLAACDLDRKNQGPFWVCAERGSRSPAVGSAREVPPRILSIKPVAVPLPMPRLLRQRCG